MFLDINFEKFVAAGFCFFAKQIGRCIQPIPVRTCKGVFIGSKNSHFNYYQSEKK